MLVRRLLLAIPAALLLVGTAVGVAEAGTLPPPGAAPEIPADSCTPTSTLAGDHYSALQIAQVAKYNGGFSGNGLVISVAVSLAESSGWTQAVLVDSDCSRDRGLWQINSYWHPEVTDAMAFDPPEAAQAAFTISSGGNDWTPWTTYDNGAYQQYMAEAQDAVNQLG